MNYVHNSKIKLELSIKGAHCTSFDVNLASMPLLGSPRKKLRKLSIRQIKKKVMTYLKYKYSVLKVHDIYISSSQNSPSWTILEALYQGQRHSLFVLANGPKQSFSL